MDAFTPNLVCFACKFGCGYLAETPSLNERIQNLIPVTCSGKVDAIHILNMLKNGADGVLIIGCPEGHCHFQDGNWRTGKRVYLLQNVIKSFGIEPERVDIIFTKDPEGKRIPQLISQMESRIKELGPIKIP